MDTPHLSKEDENQLQDDMTLVDGNSSGGEDQTDNIQDDVDLNTLTTTENIESNNDKSEDISLSGLNAMSNISEDGLWESDNLFKDLPYEEKNLGDKGNISPIKEALAAGEKPLNETPVSSSEAIPIPSLSPQLPVADNSHSLLPKITIKGVCSKPSLSATPIVLNAVSSSDSSYVVNQDNQASPIILKASEARSLLEANNNKPAQTAPQLVYVKPPPGAKIINPNQTQPHNNQFKSVILPANSIPGQTKQLVLQQSGNSPPILIPVNSVIQSGSNVIPVTQTNNGTILVPSTTNKNILVPVTASSSYKATTPSVGTKIVYSGLPSSQSNTILFPANQSVTSNTIMIPQTHKKILPTLIPNQKIILPNGSANNPYIIVPTSGTGYKPGDKILVKTTTKTLTQKAPPKIVPKISPAFNPKPGQLVLQTADGQKLLLQPIEGSKASDAIPAPQKLVFHQGRVDPASVPKTTFLPVKQSPSPVVAYTTASIPKATDSNTTITGGELKTSGIRKDMLTSIPTSIGSSLAGEKQHMRLKINVENSKGEVKETIEKDVELDTESLVKKKSVLVDILTNQKETENKNKEVDDDIAVFEIRKGSQDLIDKHKILSKKTIDNNNLKIPSSTGIGGMSYFKKSVSKDSGEVSCFVPLDVCGSETLDHLISLAQNPPSSSAEPETCVSHRVSSPQPQPQVSVKTLLKNALQRFPSKQINANNCNRRKQDLTNRNADMDLAIIKPNVVKPKPKKRASSMKRPAARRRSTVEQDEVISSITDFDLVHLQREFESNEEIDVVNSPPRNDSEMDFEIKREPLSPEVDNSVSFGNDDYTIRIKRERDDDDQYMASTSTNIKTEPNDEPTSYGESGILSSEDLVRRSFRIYNNPTHKSVHIEPDSSRSKSNTFIPLTNFLSDSPAVKLENVEDFDAYAPFDYSNVPGPISVSLKKGKKKIRALMGLKDLYIRDCPDFRIIESRFAINCKRNVYSCNQCEGEYCTINIKSLSDHLIMHQKFPKIHQLVSERPYEVSALS
ncbi:hypothetical protein LOTGIDRAFT_229115, partial [Lottia gigantea]